MNRAPSWPAGTSSSVAARRVAAAAAEAQVLTGAGLKTADDGTFEVPRMRAGRQELRFLSGDGSREFVRAVEVDSRSEELGDLEVLLPEAL